MKNPNDFDTFYDKNVSFRKRTIYLYDEMDEEMCNSTIKSFMYLEANSDAPITLYINTPGGNVYDSLGLYDVVRASNCHVTTVGVGSVMSAGTLLICAGDTRKAYPNCSFMLHSLSDFLVGKLNDIKIGAAEALRVHKVMLDIYKERTNKKTTKWWDNTLKDDNYMNAADALKIGLIDEIMEIE